VSLATVLVMLPWSIRNAVVAPPPPTDQNFIYSYWTGIFHADAGDPRSPARPLAELAAIFPARARAIVELLGARLEGRGGVVASWILGAWMLASVGVLLARRARASEILFVLVGLVLLTYFGFRIRLGLPLFVIGLAAWAETSADLAARFLGRTRARAVVAAVLLALAALDFQPQNERDLRAREFASEEAQARAFAAHLGADSRAAERVSWHYALLHGRPVWSLRFAIDRDPERNVAAIEGVIDRYGLDTVLVGPAKIESFYLPYLQARYGPGARAGEGWVFRVRP